MTAVSLVRLYPDLAALAGWAIPLGYMDGVADPGYALHAALKAALGDLAPRPFVLRERKPTMELLGYVAAPPCLIKESVAIAGAADAGALAALRLDRIEAKPMPAEWVKGRRWSFEVRLRPVVRSRPQGRDGREEEVDAAFWRARRVAGETPPAREAVYAEWLAERLASGGAARLVVAEMKAIRSTSVLRRPRLGGQRQRRCIPGPDVTARGELEVLDSSGFSRLVAQGVGRHRAFGFGCLLLAPPGVF